jgi:predicted RNA-binding protein YlxR (DUF448 family)
MISVAKKKNTRKKHIPQRTCVGCRQVLAKRTLIRLVRTAEGVFVDPTGKMSGRGAYLHNQRSCWEAGLKSRLERALKTTLSQADRDRLGRYAEEVPEEETAPLP